MHSLGYLAVDQLWRIFWLLPASASEGGRGFDKHLLLNLWIVVALFLLAHTFLAAGLLASRNRSAGRETARRTVRLEYLPLALLTLLLSWLAFRAERLWAQSRYTGAAPTALQIEVTGMQFVWYFRYPGSDATFGRLDAALIDAGAGNPLGLDRQDVHGHDDLVTSELVLPAGREVDLRLRSIDVIHGFAVPAMRIKQNAVPGQIVHLHFTPMQPGIYAIMCTQVCGLGHYRMNANLRVLSPEDFASWLEARERPEVR